MKIKEDSYMYEMIRTELADVAGSDGVDVKFADKFGHSIDYYSGVHQLLDGRRLPRVPRHGRPLDEVRQDRGHGDEPRGRDPDGLNVKTLNEIAAACL